MSRCFQTGVRETTEQAKAHLTSILNKGSKKGFIIEAWMEELQSQRLLNWLYFNRNCE